MYCMRTDEVVALRRFNLCNQLYLALRQSIEQLIPSVNSTMIPSTSPLQADPYLYSHLSRFQDDPNDRWKKFKPVQETGVLMSENAD